MRFNRKRVAVLATVAGLAIAGGAAYTTSTDTSALTNPGNDGLSLAGYGTVTVTGGSVIGINYTIDTQDPPDVTAVTFVALGDTTNASGYVGFNGSTGPTTMDTCAAGTSGSGTYAGDTVYSCSVTGYAGPSGSEPVASINSTDIALAASSS